MGWYSKIAYYYQPKGRDSAIKLWNKSRENIIGNLEKEKTGIEMKKLEQVYNAAYYPLNAKTNKNLKEVLQNAGDKVLNKAGGAVVGDTLGDIPLVAEGTGVKGGGYAHRVEEKIGGLMKQSKTSVSVIERRLNQLYRLLENAQKAGLNTKYANEFDKAASSLSVAVESFNNIIKEFGGLDNAFTKDAFSFQDGNAKGSIGRKVVGQNNNIFTDIGQVIADARVIIDNFPAEEMDELQFGIFLEEAVDLGQGIVDDVCTDVINASMSQLIFGTDGDFSITRQGDKTTQMGKDTIGTCTVSLPIDDVIEVYEEFGEVIKGKPHEFNIIPNQPGGGTKIVVKHYGENDFEITTNKSLSYRLNSNGMQKADVMFQISKGDSKNSYKPVGVSLKNWNNIYSGSIDALLPHSIFQTLGGERALKTFSFMLQDIQADETGSGEYTGNKAVKDALEMARVCGAVTALMGYGQVASSRANILMINDRQNKCFHAFDIPSILLDFIENNNSNIIKYNGISLDDAAFMYKESHLFSSAHRHDLYYPFMVAYFSERKLKYSLRPKKS